MKVKVHWNLHKGGYSVTNTKTKLVMPEFTDNIVITNPIAKIAQGKYDDCHTIGKRHVCAWITGEMMNPTCNADRWWSMIDNCPASNALANFSGGDMLSYNPFKNRHFTNQDGVEIPFNESLGEFAIFTTDDNGKPMTIVTKRK